MIVMKDILLQFFFITFPILFCEIGLLTNRQSRLIPTRLFFALTSSLAVLLCMSFPITIDGGLQYDLRSIPIVLSFLYGGFQIGTLTFVIMLLYRMFLGGEGLWVVVFGSLYLALPIYLAARWHRFSQGRKVLLAFVIGMAKQLTTAVVFVAMGLLKGMTIISLLPRLELFMAVGFIYIGGLIPPVLFAGYLRETALMRMQLQNSEKLALISELAASVAHEVRNPLTVVRGFVQLLREGVDPERKEYIKLVLAELDRAEFIISDYLNLARPQDEIIETFDAAEMTQEVNQVMFSYGLMNRVQLKVHLEEQGLYIRGDKRKCKQALMNLIKNGIEAMPGGGTIGLTAERIAQLVMIRITDTGQGMSPAQLKQMGQPFFTTKEKGTGLGLLVSIRIVEAMGGTIHFESEIGKGTQVTIMLPLHLQSE